MLNLAQAAQQVAESSHLVLDKISIGLILATILSLAKGWMDSKGRKRAEKERDNPPCENHQERIAMLEKSALPGKEGRIATLEEQYKNIKGELLESRRENREDHGKIFDQIGGLAKEIRNAK